MSRLLDNIAGYIYFNWEVVVIGLSILSIAFFVLNRFKTRKTRRKRTINPFTGIQHS